MILAVLVSAEDTTCASAVVSDSLSSFRDVKRSFSSLFNASNSDLHTPTHINHPCLSLYVWMEICLSVCQYVSSNQAGHKVKGKNSRVFQPFSEQ